MRVALPLVVLAAACTPHPAPPASDQAQSDTGCDAAAVQQFVGRPADTVASEALRLSGAKVLRRYKTGDMLTMDLRADRLNVETDAGGTIVRVHCG